MADVLDGVTQTVGEVVRGVDTPGVPGVGVRGVLDPVGHWVLLAVLHYVFHTQGGLGTGERVHLHGGAFYSYIHRAIVEVRLCKLLLTYLSFFKLSTLHILQ